MSPDPNPPPHRPLATLVGGDRRVKLFLVALLTTVVASLFTVIWAFEQTSDAREGHAASEFEHRRGRGRHQRRGRQRPVVTTTVVTTTTRPPAPPSTALPLPILPPPTVAPPPTVTTPPPATTVPPRPAASPGGYVSPGSIGSTVGPPAEPTSVYGGPTTISTPGTVIDGMRVDGCLRIEANDVTIRNSVIECTNYYPILATGVSGLVVERSRLRCAAEPWKAFHLQSTQFSVVGNEAANCEDHFYIDGSIGASRIASNVLWQTQLAPGAHADGIQMGSTGAVHGSLVIERNWFQGNGSVASFTAAIFLDDGDADVVIRNNWIDGSYGYYPVRCYTNYRCRVESNTVSPLVHAFTLVAGSHPVVARCNVFEDGSLVPESQFSLEGSGRVVFEPC